LGRRSQITHHFDKSISRKEQILAIKRACWGRRTHPEYEESMLGKKSTTYF
jgi:hypothetical protein